jgi:iron complex outermembrane receptor protein
MPATGWFSGITFSVLVNNLFDAKFSSNGYFYTFDDNFSNPGTVTTVEGVGYYPQAGIHFLAGATLQF